MIAPSLKGRLLLILMVATVAIQALSFGGVGLLRGFDSRMLRNEVIAKDVAFAYGELAAAAPAARATRAAAMRRGGYGFNIVPGRLSMPVPGSEDLRLIQQSVRKLTGAPPGPVHGAPDAKGHAAFGLALDAGTQLVVGFDDALEATRPPLVGMAVYIAAVSAAVLAIAWIAVRLATRPLEVFTQAANRLAANLDTEALPVDGPIEVRGAARAFNAMHVEIRRQLQERSQILAAISHDLKTPLTRLKLRLDGFEANDQRALMVADVDAMAGLIQDGLDYARSQQLRETRKPVDLNHLVQRIVDQALDLDMDCRMSGQCLRPFPAAPRALERVLQNLVDNGLRYGQRVHIKLFDHADSVELQVHDDGPGLPVELLEKVFDPYYRAETSRNRSTGGTGLGLSIARNLVQAHGGRIWLERGAPAGLVARVSLPFGA